MLGPKTQDLRIEVGLRFLLPVRRIVEQQHRHLRRLRREQLAQATLREQHHRRRIFEHHAQPRGRISGIERHIRAARLEHRQQRNHHLHATLHADRHPRIGLHAQTAQPMRQPIGLRVQLRVAELSLLEQQRHRIRAAVHLRLEQLVNAAIRHRRSGLVPSIQHLMPLRRAQQRQPINPLLLIGHHRFKQVAEVTEIALDRRVLEQRARIFQTADDLRAPLLQRERHIKPRGDARRSRAQPPGFQARKRHLGASGRVAPSEHHLKDRRMVQAAYGLHQLHHLLKRYVLVALRAQCLRARLLDQLAHRRRARQVQAQRY